VNMVAGKVTHRGVANAFGMPSCDIGVGGI